MFCNFKKIPKYWESKVRSTEDGWMKGKIWETGPQCGVCPSLLPAGCGKLQGDFLWGRSGRDS